MRCGPAAVVAREVLDLLRLLGLTFLARGRPAGIVASH
jgi:hypothetical protein